MKRLLAYPLSAGWIGKAYFQELGWLAARSVTGLKNCRIWIVLCDNTFQSKLVFAHWALGLRACTNLQGCSRSVKKDPKMDDLGIGERRECNTETGEGHILHVVGLALKFKNNSDQQLFSSADGRQTRHTLDYSICSLGRRRAFSTGSPSSKPSFTVSRLGPGLLDEGHPLLVLAVALVVLLLFSRLTGLCAVIGHQWSRGLLYVQN